MELQIIIKMFYAWQISQPHGSLPLLQAECGQPVQFMHLTHISPCAELE